MPYSDDYEAKTGIQVVQAATRYTASDGQEYILILNEALWMPDLDHTLINPNQLRHSGVTVQDNPYGSDIMKIQAGDFSFALKSLSTTIYMPTWTPSDSDLEQLPRVVLSSDCPWDPSTVQFPQDHSDEVIEMESSNNIASVHTWEHQHPETIEDVAPLVLFDAHLFQMRVAQTAIMEVSIGEGPLWEDELTN